MVAPMRKVLSLWIASAVVLVAPAIVPEVAAQSPAPDYYGTADTNYHYISAEEFQETSRSYYRWDSDGFWVADLTGLYNALVAPLRLPTGALVDGYTVIYEDSDAVDDLSLKLNRHWVGSLGSVGSAQIGATFTTYVFWLEMDTSVDLSFRGIIVQWKRQVSPAPTTATFSDVPVGSFGFKHVEALAASGITAGCGGGNFCPNNTLTRVEMAIFLAKALGLHWSP